MPIDPRLIPTPQDPTSRLMARLADQEARIATLERSRKGAILDTYSVLGANSAWVLLGGAGQGVYVNAAQTTLLRWLYTPTVDCWAEVTACMMVWNGVSAAWQWHEMNLVCSPTPTAGPTSGVYSRVFDHSGGSGAGVSHRLNATFGLTAGVQYSMACGSVNAAGNVFYYYQGAGYLQLHGKSWAR